MSQTLECNSLKDIHLTFTYDTQDDNKKFTAYFKKVYTFADFQNRLNTIQSFADKINEFAEKHDTKATPLPYRLEFKPGKKTYDNSKPPTLTIKFNRASPTTIPKFIKFICQEAKGLKIKVPPFDDTPRLPASTQAKKEIVCTDRKNPKSCGGSPNCNWRRGRGGGRCQARGGVRSKGLVFEGPERK